MHTVRVVIGGALALAMAGLSVVCCYIFGTHLAPGTEGQVYGALGAVADSLKALLPLGITAAFLSGQKLRGVIGIILFTVFSIYSFASELGLYALSWDAQTSNMAAGRELYAELKAERSRVRDRLKALGQLRPSRTIRAELAGQFQNPSWHSSSRCHDATIRSSRTFCAGIARLKGELASAEEAEGLRAKSDALGQKLAGIDLAEALKSADPQAEALARLTGWPASRIRDGLAILVALLIELGSGFGLYAATASGHPAALKKEGPIASPAPAPPQDTIRPAAPSRVLAAENRPAVISEPADAGPSTDPVRAFARAAIVKRQGRELPAAGLHAAFTRWCGEAGVEPLSPAALGRRLTAMGFDRTKRGGKQFYLNIEIKPSVPQNRESSMLN